MDRLKEVKLDEAGLRPDITSRLGNIAKSVRSRGIGSYTRWESKLEKAASSQRHAKSAVEMKSQEPPRAQLNLKSALMGVHIMVDSRDYHLSRQSSASSMLSSGAVPFKWESEPGKPFPRPEAKKDLLWSPLPLPPGSRGNSGLLYSQPLARENSQAAARSSRTPSGLLYPCPNPGSSCQLNAAHFTFDNQQLAKDLAGDSGSDNIERIFKRLVGQSRLQQCSTRGVKAAGHLDTRSDYTTGADELSDSPVSTLDYPQSPTSSERSFRGKSKRQSLRSRSEDANLMAAAKDGPIDPTTPRPKSELAQYLMSISALKENAMDDDDLEGPNEVAWLEPDDGPYDTDLGDGYTSGNGKKKPSHERWSSSSSSWNVSLVPKPLRSVSTIVTRRHATNSGRSVRKSSRQAKADSIMPIWLTASYDGGTIRSRALRKSSQSECNSGRSWWPDLGSGMKSSVLACSGRLQMEVAPEPDLHEPDMEQANDVKSRHQQFAPAKVDEEDFPFEKPISSSFLFQEDSKFPSIAAAAQDGPGSRASLHKAIISVVDSENDDLQFSDTYHDPEDGFISDGEGSHISVGLRDGSDFVSSRSFKEYRDLVDYIGCSGSLLSDMSGRAFSGYLELGTSRRFSVDLQRGQKLDKAQYVRTPDVSLRELKSGKSSKRSILSPCLPFLHRSHNKNVPRIQQAPVAEAPSRRLQPVNSFTARLGPGTENSNVAAHSQLS